jgi:hypothetical protein
MKEQMTDGTNLAMQSRKGELQNAPTVGQTRYGPHEC